MHPAIPSQLFSTTLLCTQPTNTKHRWQNGTRCRDGVNVLWWCSHLVWLVFEGSIPTCTCFHSENFFVTFTSLFEAAGVLLLFLPPYSPDYMPIEDAFSYIKAYLRLHNDVFQVTRDPIASCIHKHYI